jgi:Xaa-Pro aminopeptidase
MVASARTAKLRERLVAENTDAVAITSVANIAYCTGWSGVFDDEPAHVVLVGAAGAAIFTDGRYIEALRTAARGTEWQVRLVTDWLVQAVAEELRAVGATRLALETSLSHARFEGFSAAHSGDVIEATGWVEELRATKDSEEISAIEAAQALTDSAFRHIVEDGVVCAGALERDIALELEFFMRKEGSEGVAFPPIVASGPNSALPHAVPSERKLAEGDFVVLDFGARVGGYCSDMTRTVVIGNATSRHREIYDAALEANRVGIAAVAAGRPGREIDAEARAVIAERGFGEYFGHGLGHGVGLEVHERPGLGPRSEAPVPLGAVVTIEPGIYVPGYGGVRIEDLAVVQEGGARVLTRSTKELLEL